MDDRRGQAPVAAGTSVVELLDAGDGRRLDRFGARVVDRPAPGAVGPRRDPDAWRDADLRFERGTGWTGPRATWTVQLDGIVLELRPTPAGQVGLFPEHAYLWPWLRAMLESRPGGAVLHLFAYTGATTLTLAAAGARVAHVDASRPAVAWARRNAELSGLAGAPIRWLVDDAEAFVRRESRRGRRYDGIVLDPPSFGHGASGSSWKLEERLGELVDACLAVAAPGAFLALTTHTPGWTPNRLREVVVLAGGRPMAASDTGRLELEAASGAVLPLGAFVTLELAP